ncbi:hypothetical protein EP331_13925 [bacterium]|nr:MAG: hypothetical protein EP331_13925 [bacterium]
MKKNHFFFTLLLFVSIFSSNRVSGQVFTPGITSISEFKRELDNFNWSYKTDGNWNWKQHSLGFTSTLNSRLFLFNKIAQNVQDETLASVWSNHKLTKTLFLFTNSDYYSFTNTDVTTFQTRAGIGFRFWDISLKPSLGFYSDTRSKRTDQGLQMALQTQSAPIQLDDDFRTQFNGQILYADLEPRTFHQTFVQSRTNYQTQELSVSLNGTYSFNERDSYQPSSFFNRNITDIIEKVISDTTKFQLSLNTQLNDELRFSFTGLSLYNIRNFENKPLTESTENSIIDTRYTRQEIEGITSLDFNYGLTQGQIGLRYAISGLDAKITRTLNISDEQLTRRDEQLRNTFYNQEITELFAKSSWNLTASQSINANATISILRFDTPETNFDDRDELFTALEVEHKFISGSSYQTSILLSGETYHRVFLFSQRSIENNKRQSLRLQPSMIWFPTKRIRWANQFLVRANYTVYDFQSTDGTIRDQSSREWGLSSDIRWEFVNNWFANILVSRNRLLIGQLFWNEFSETPIDTLTTTRVETALEWQKQGVYAKVGMRLFIKDDYVPVTVLQLNNETENLTRFVTGNQQTFQFGPMVSIRWTSSKYGEVSVDGWLQLQYLRNQWYVEVPNNFQSALSEDERFKRTRIFPNLSIRTKLFL